NPTLLITPLSQLASDEYPPWFSTITLIFSGAANSHSRRNPSAASFACSSREPLDRALTRIEWHPRNFAASTHCLWFSTHLERASSFASPMLPAVSHMMSPLVTPTSSQRFLRSV